MNCKKIFSAVVAVFCVISLLTACNGNRDVQHANSSKAFSTLKGTHKSTIRQIKFHDTIDDPQTDYVNSLDRGVTKTSGTATLDLVLNEVEPSAFEGCGSMVRSLEIKGDESFSSKQQYIYRTGVIHTKPGQEGSLTMYCNLMEDRTMGAMLLEAPFKLNIHKDGSARQENLRFKLTQEGDKALLTITLHQHAKLIFKGELATGNSETTTGPSSAENLIYINSLWSGTYSGGGEDCTAILLATPAADKKSYSGQLSVQGDIKVIKNLDKTVVFTLEPFSDALYKQSGGKLKDRFSQMGRIHTDSGDYLLLLDGKQAVLETVGKVPCFFGQLYPQSRFDFFKNEASKTKKILSYLCRQTTDMKNAFPDAEKLKGLDPNDPEDMKTLMKMSEQLGAMANQSQAPAWYPGELIPTSNFSDEDGYSPVSSGEELFKIYGTQYVEIDDIEPVFEHYHAVLSSYDNYQECFKEESSEGVFVFSMGKYYVQVFLLQQVSGQTDVTVQIY